jgi:hypothetical protein
MHGAGLGREPLPLGWGFLVRDTPADIDGSGGGEVSKQRLIDRDHLDCSLRTPPASRMPRPQGSDLRTAHALRRWSRGAVLA